MNSWWSQYLDIKYDFSGRLGLYQFSILSWDAFWVGQYDSYQRTFQIPHSSFQEVEWNRLLNA